MRKLVIILTVILLCGCHTNIAKPVQNETSAVDMELGIKRAAIFFLIMSGNKFGDDELEAEIKYLEYLIRQKK